MVVVAPAREPGLVGVAVGRHPSSALVGEVGRIFVGREVCCASHEE